MNFADIIEQIDSFVSMASKICDKVEVGQTYLELSNLSLIKNNAYREKLENLKRKQSTEKKRYKCCPQVFDTIAIRWNGDITACCADIDGIMTLGNIMNNSVVDCWNGERENAYRKILSEGRYDAIEKCKDCYDVYGWTYGEN